MNAQKSPSCGIANTSSTVPVSVPIMGISEQPKRVLLNYNYDILSTENGK